MLRTGDVYIKQNAQTTFYFDILEELHGQRYLIHLQMHLMMQLKIFFRDVWIIPLIENIGKICENDMMSCAKSFFLVGKYSIFFFLSVKGRLL